MAELYKYVIRLPVKEWFRIKCRYGPSDKKAVISPINPCCVSQSK